MPLAPSTHYRDLTFLAGICWMLGACSTPQVSPAESQSSAAQVASAATAPLNDLNLVKTEIAPVLVAAKNAPYRVVNANCEAIAQEVVALDNVLGPDVDAAPQANTTNLLDRGTQHLSQKATGALRTTTEGLIPFRGWIRKLSGAQKHSESMTAAVAAGIVRRAYLKGYGEKMGCAAPAAPLVAQPAIPLTQTP